MVVYYSSHTCKHIVAECCPSEPEGEVKQLNFFSGVPNKRSERQDSGKFGASRMSNRFNLVGTHNADGILLFSRQNYVISLEIDEWVKCENFEIFLMIQLIRFHCTPLSSHPMGTYMS